VGFVLRLVTDLTQFSFSFMSKRWYGKRRRQSAIVGIATGCAVVGGAAIVLIGILIFKSRLAASSNCQQRASRENYLPAKLKTNPYGQG
jgi:hypothetical protein